MSAEKNISALFCYFEMKYHSRISMFLTIFTKRFFGSVIVDKPRDIMQKKCVKIK